MTGGFEVDAPESPLRDSRKCSLTQERFSHHRADGAPRFSRQGRGAWLHPAEWNREESIEFRAAIDGPWRHAVKNPNGSGIGTASYAWLVPADEMAEKAMKRRTLTALYNDPPAWLRELHDELNRAVLAAYGLPADANDDTILSHLLSLNLARTGETEEYDAGAKPKPG